jgi:hypothetical protein
LEQLLTIPFYKLFQWNMCDADENWRPGEWDLADPGVTQSEEQDGAHKVWILLPYRNTMAERPFPGNAQAMLSLTSKRIGGIEAFGRTINEMV